MYRSSVIKILAPWFLLFAFTACGPMSLTDGSNDLAGGGIGGTGISVGKITAFGSVWVNGVEYSTTGAIISIEGTESISDGSLEYDRSLLDEGKIVTVYWAKDANGNPVAERIEFKDNLEGPISAESIDYLVSQTFEVLGQTIKVDVDTIFDGTTDLSTLRDGNIVEVSGFVDAKGIIHASYISLKSLVFEGDGSEIELKGIVANLDADAMKFTIGTQTIDYSNAMFEHMTLATLDNGLYVEAKSSAGVIGGVLIASKIELEEKGHHVEVGHEFEVEGYVTVESVLTDGMFELEGQSVQITSNTMFENGVSAADIVVDVKLEVEGTVDAFGILVADKIEIESGDDGNHDSEDVSSDDSDNDAGDNAP